MVLQEIGGGGYDDVQSTAPSNPSIGDTWLDTSTDPPTGKIYADLGGGGQWTTGLLDSEVSSRATQSDILIDGVPFPGQDVIQSPVPEVQDPLNLQSGLSGQSGRYETDGQDYVIYNNRKVLADYEDQSTSPSLADWSLNGNDTGNFSTVGGVNLVGDYSAKVETPSGTLTSAKYEYSGGSVEVPIISFHLQIDYQSSASDAEHEIKAGNNGDDFGVNFQDDGTIYTHAGATIGTWSIDTHYKVTIYNIDYDASEYSVKVEDLDAGSIVGDINETNNNINSAGIDQISFDIRSYDGVTKNSYFDEFLIDTKDLQTSVTDRFAASTTTPGNFKQWNSIQAQGVTEGASTSTDPVEFDILDSTDTALNSSRIPKSQIADSAFTLRGRVYSENAGSDGQSDYQISTTGDGGHYGISILTVATVKKNGSVIGSDNWSFDPSTDTVTIDTSSVTISNGDTIGITYHFDITGNVLQPRAYLSRESVSEQSPSISHFRYEFLTGSNGISNAIDWSSKTYDYASGDSQGSTIVNGSGYLVGVSMNTTDSGNSWAYVEIDGKSIQFFNNMPSGFKDITLMARFEEDIVVGANNGLSDAYWHYILD